MLEQQEKVVMMMTMRTLMVVMMMTMMTLMVVISIKNGITNLLMVGVLVNCSDDCDINDDGNDGDYDHKEDPVHIYYDEVVSFFVFVASFSTRGALVI